MKTQNFKSVSLRQLFDNAIAGRPINAHSVSLFDLADSDLDDDNSMIIDNDFGDALENLQDLRDYAQYKREKLKQKGGIKDETPQRSQDETPQTLPSE